MVVLPVWFGSICVLRFVAQWCRFGRTCGFVGCVTLWWLLVSFCVFCVGYRFVMLVFTLCRWVADLRGALRCVCGFVLRVLRG